MSDTTKDKTLRDAMKALSDTALALGFSGTDLGQVPAHAEVLYGQWAAYRTLGVAGINRSGDRSFDPPGPAVSEDWIFQTEVADLLGRHPEVGPDVLMDDIRARLIGDREELAKLHYPTGPLCSVCDTAPHYGEGINNPGCSHEFRGCHECQTRTWPCRTSRIMQTDEWYDPWFLDAKIVIDDDVDEGAATKGQVDATVVAGVGLADVGPLVAERIEQAAKDEADAERDEVERELARLDGQASAWRRATLAFYEAHLLDRRA